MGSKSELSGALRTSLLRNASSKAMWLVWPVASLALATTSAHAQTPDTAVEEIVVTGTTIRGVAPTGSQVVAITREQMLTSPIRDASAIVARIPQGSNLGISETTNNASGNAINLRGLGNTATLLLIDGHRVVPQGIQTTFNDPNQIPFGAIQRVDVVMDGASAVYGSDAIAGVVNYVLRSNYEGVSVTARTTFNDMYSGYVLDGMVGKSWDGINIMAALAHEDREGFRANKRQYFCNDLREYGGNDNRLQGTLPTAGLTPFITVGGVNYGVPLATSGRPSTASVLALRNNIDIGDACDFAGHLPDRTRTSGLVKLNADIFEGVRFTYSALYTNRRSRIDLFSPVQITVPSNSPWYIPGLSATNAPLTVSYNPSANGLPRFQDRYDKTTNQYAELRVDLWGDWQSTSSIVYGSSRGCGSCGIELNQFVRLEYATRNPEYLNPYIVGFQPGLNKFFNYSYQYTKGGLIGGATRIEGPLFNLPAGAVRTSVGVEYNEISFKLQIDQGVRNYEGVTQRVRDAEATRGAKSAFAEAFVPVLSRLDLSLAARLDRYSDFGSTINPRVGLKWEPIDELQFNGTWGTAFRAPTLTEINEGLSYGTGAQEITNNSGDASLPITNAARGTSIVIRHTGSNPDLDPEKAKLWSVGFSYRPNWLLGLAVKSSLYNVNYTGKIESVNNPNSALSSAENRKLYGIYLTVAPQPANCVPGNYATYNPIYVPWFTSPFRLASAPLATECQAVALQQAGLQNTGSVKQTGLDLGVTYDLSNSMGDWTFGFSLAKILKQSRAFLPGAPETDTLNQIGYQVKDRANADFGWSRNGLRASFSVNYIGSYLNNTPITVAGVSLGNSTVPAWTTFDASIAYTFPEGSSRLSGLRLQLGARNLTDKDPPIVLAGTNAIDIGTHDPYGRTIQFEISKEF